MATRTNRTSVDVNVGSPQNGHVPIYDESIRLWTTTATSSFFLNLTLDQISGSVFANRTYTFPRSLIISSSVTASNVSASNGYVNNVYSQYISSSILSASDAYIRNLYSPYISASNISTTNGYISNVYSSYISSSILSASDAYIPNLYGSYISSSTIITSTIILTSVTSSEVSASVVNAENANATNVFTTLISSSIASASNALLTNVFSQFISSSTVSASQGFINTAYIPTVYSGLISSSVASASNALLTNVFSTIVSSSTVSASNALLTNLFSQLISSSEVSASNALLTNVFSTLVSSSAVSASQGFIGTGYIPNIYSTIVSSSIVSASNALLTNIFSNTVSASIVSASQAFIGIGYIPTVYANNVSSSIISASSAALTSISASLVSASQAFIGIGYIPTVYANNISSSIFTASVATIPQISASNITNTNSYSTNVYSVLMSSSIVTGSTIFAETASVMTLGIGTRNPEYPLDVKNTTAHGIRGMFGPHPTSSVTIWDGIYQANHPLRIKLPELDSSYFSISNKKPYGGISDDEYYQFVNFLELADYTADDNEAVYVMTNRSTYNSPYSHSAGITTFANLQDNLGGYVSSVYGNYNVLRTFGVGTTTNISTGLLGWTTVENSARVNTGYGFYGLLQLQTNATVGNYYNFFGVTQLGTGGSVSNLYGTYLSTAGNQSVSSIGNYAGLVSTTGTITASNNTLVLLGTGTIPAGNYAIYNSSSYDNYFRGNVGVGTPTPTVRLDVVGNTNITGDLTVSGLLTAISTSIQYVTSSQLVVGDNRIVVNVNENLRFGGISVNDSGSAVPTSGSLYWDSLRNHWLYENASGGSYNSAILISGPKHTGTLGGETELTPNKLVYAVGTDHIGDAPANTNGTDIFIENNLGVTGSLVVKQTGSFEGFFSASTVDISGLTTLRQVLEKATITASGINGSVNYDLLSQAVWFYTTDATGNWSVNFRGNAGTTLNSMMKIGQSLTSVLIITNGATPRNFTGHAIDGVTITPKWQHGEIPSYGIANSVEVFSYNIIKLADATFSVLAARTAYT